MNRKNYIELYKISLSNLLRRYISSGQMEELIKLYGKDKLLSIVDYVQVVNDNLVIPSSDSEIGKIVRYIQFGGPKVPALHLITRAKGG